MNSQISGQAFQIFIQSLKNGDIIILLQLRPFFEEIVVPILQSRPNLVSLYRIHFQNLLNAIHTKLRVLPCSQIKIFPGIAKIVESIQCALDMSKFERVKQGESRVHTRDQYFLKFLRDEQVRMKNHDNSSYYDIEDGHNNNQTIKVRMPVLISHKTYTKQWQTLFAVLRQQFKLIKDPTLPQKRALAYNEIKAKQISFPLCLGCTQFYYDRVNIRYMSLHQADVIVVSKIRQLNLNKDLLKNSICALLNSGGGIILFDCLEQYLQILPVGSFISEVQKELYIQQISEIFKYFHPRISFGINIQLKFVPVAENLFQNAEDASYPHFVKGKYVTRLRVWNNQRWRMITYDPNGNQNIVYIRKENHTERVSARRLPRLIKRVFKKYYCPQFLNKSVFQRPQNMFEDHQCIQAKMGIPLQSKQYDIQQIMTQYDRQMKSQRKISFIFLQNLPFEPFKTALKKGIGALQVIPHNPPTSDSLCLLFHSTAHKEMQLHFNKVCDIVKDKYHIINRKPPMMLFVENGLGLKQPLDHSSFKELTNYIKHKNSTETLTYYEGKGNYYLTSDFKVTLFFMFAKLRQMDYHGTEVLNLNLKQLKNDNNYKIIEAHQHV